MVLNFYDTFPIYLLWDDSAELLEMNITCFHKHTLILKVLTGRLEEQLLIVIPNIFIED